MPAVDSDRDLIRQVAAGNETALRRHDAYGQRLYVYALRITSDPAAAEEAVQESLMAIWQGAASSAARAGGPVITWLPGIVHHKALNQVRGLAFRIPWTRSPSTPRQVSPCLKQGRCP